MLYWPCVIDMHGKVRTKVTLRPMSFVAAENFLRDNYNHAWRFCNAVPQAVTHPYFENDPNTIYWLLKDETAS
jgi:hypothetical protein